MLKPIRIALIGGLLLTLNTAHASCELENSQQTDNGVSGRCPNSGQEIRCTFETGEGWTCNGPMGEYSGSDLQGAVEAACGC
jgi:hypothetical protein